MAVKYSVQIHETVGLSEKEWLIHSNVSGGFTLVKIDLFWTLGDQVSTGWSSTSFSALEAGMWGIEVVDTGAGAYSIGANFDDFRTVGLHGYGSGSDVWSFPGGTTNGIAASLYRGGLAWRGSRYYPNASDLYLAYSQENLILTEIPQAWCSLTLWTG